MNLPTESTDPKLLAAADEIVAVLRKHDIAALVTLQSERHTHFVREIAPSWSCAKIEEDDEGGVTIRFRAKLVDFPDRAAQKQCVEQTVGMFFGFAHQAETDKEMMIELLTVLGRQFDISNILGAVTPRIFPTANLPPDEPAP